MGFWLTKSITNEGLPDWLDTRKDCCDEEIIRRGDNGFDKGDTIETTLRSDCTTAKINVETDNLRVRLAGFYYYYVSVCNVLFVI